MCMLFVCRDTSIWICISCKMLAVLDWGRTPSKRKQHLGKQHENSLLCDRCACELIQDEVHALLMCTDTDVCASRRKFAYALTYPVILGWFLSLSAQQMVYNFLSQHNSKLFVCVWAYNFIVEWWRPVAGWSAEQSNWRSPHACNLIKSNPVGEVNQQGTKRWKGVTNRL